MRQTNVEKMRYSVPGVRNRFFAVHIKFIALCALLALTAITISLSYLTIREVYRLEPKPVFTFYCEVDDYDGVRSKLDRYDGIFNIKFAVYEDGYKPDGQNDGLLLEVTSHTNPKLDYKYSDIGKADRSTLTADDILSLIERARR